MSNTRLVKLLESTMLTETKEWGWDFPERKFLCTVCGYIYFEYMGDPDGSFSLSGPIPEGTKWEDVPENWCCPICGATKAEFAEIIWDDAANKWKRLDGKPC